MSGVDFVSVVALGSIVSLMWGIKGELEKIRELLERNKEI